MDGTIPKAKRLLKLLFLVQSGLRYNVPAIAAEFGVSRRTVFRDVATLRESGIPVFFDSRSDAFRIAEDRTLEVGGLSDGELALLILGMKSSSVGVQASAYYEELELAMRRLLDGLSEGRRLRLSQLLDRISVASDEPCRLSPNAKVSEAEILVTFAAALQHERRLKVSFRDFDGAVTELRFETHRLRFDRRWAAIGVAAPLGEPHRLQLSTVLNAELLDERYAMPNDRCSFSRN